jgi:hypothetical protein
LAKASERHATRPYLGAGNPLLDGLQNDRRWATYYKDQGTTSLAPRSVGEFRRLFRGAQAVIEEVRAWRPLPETADELCTVGRQLGVADIEIMLGANATETKLKALSEEGRLADYAILHSPPTGPSLGRWRVRPNQG